MALYNLYYIISVNFVQLKSAAPNGKNTETLHKDISDLTSQVEQARNEANKAQAEVDRLLAIMKESENEKNEKENQIKEQQEYVYFTINSTEHKYIDYFMINQYLVNLHVKFLTC